MGWAYYSIQTVLFFTVFLYLNYTPFSTFSFYLTNQTSDETTVIATAVISSLLENKFLVTGNISQLNKGGKEANISFKFTL